MYLYPISELERLSGVKAHTIRIWEKRYDLIEPARTDTNIRFYSDDQLKKLLNVATLVGLGHKISHVSIMSVLEINNLLEKSFNESKNDDFFEIGINALSQSMINFDEIEFNKIFQSSIEKCGVSETYISLIYPFLIKIGMYWSIDKIGPAHEHFVSSIIRMKLATSIEKIAITKHKNKKIILFLLPNEWHEIGLMMAHFILKQKGIQTIYLGQNTPITNLEATIQNIKADGILTFFNSRNIGADQSNDLNKILKSNPKLELILCTPKDIKHGINHKNKTEVHSVADLEKIS
jgi:MerR family transcriptional regulator, light-induced transcriptional regulator